MRGFVGAPSALAPRRIALSTTRPFLTFTAFLPMCRFLTRSAAALLALLGLVTMVAAATPPPNILCILTDDQGWPTLGCYGNKRVPTPHLDRLATEGVRFTD